MNHRTRFLFVAGLPMILSIVVAASVAAHPSLPGAPDLPLHIGGDVHDLHWNRPAQLLPPPLSLPATGIAQLLPNWEVGRNALMLLPNYEPGTVTFELLELRAIFDPAPLLVAPHAAQTDLDKP